jgi:transposase
VPAIPSWLLEPLWDQFAALLPDRPVYDPAHPLGCHKPRIGDRIIFEKLIQVLRFGCSYASIADCTCGATTIRDRRDEWIKAGIFGKLKTIARESYDRIVGLVLHDLAVDGCIAKAPGGGACAGPSPVDRRKLGMKRSLLVEGYGIPLGRVLAPANRHDSPLLAPTLDKLDDLGPLPEDITVHLDAGYDSQKTRDELAGRGMTGEIAHKGDKAPSRRGSAGISSGPTPGTTPSTGCNAATSATRTSSARSSTSPTPSSPSVALSARHGPSTDGTAARQDGRDHLPIRAASYLVI